MEHLFWVFGCKIAIGGVYTTNASAYLAHALSRLLLPSTNMGLVPKPSEAERENEICD